MPKTATPAFMNKLFQRAGGKCECRGNHCSCHAPRVRCNAPLRRNQWAAHRQWAGGNYVLSNTKALCARCYRDIHGRKNKRRFEGSHKYTLTCKIINFGNREIGNQSTSKSGNQENPST